MATRENRGTSSSYLLASNPLVLTFQITPSLIVWIDEQKEGKMVEDLSADSKEAKSGKRRRPPSYIGCPLDLRFDEPTYHMTKAKKDELKETETKAREYSIDQEVFCFC
jgi:hypothetical protein